MATIHTVAPSNQPTDYWHMTQFKKKKNNSDSCSNVNNCFRMQGLSNLVLKQPETLAYNYRSVIKSLFWKFISKVITYFSWFPISELLLSESPLSESPFLEITSQWGFHTHTENEYYTYRWRTWFVQLWQVNINFFFCFTLSLSYEKCSYSKYNLFQSAHKKLMDI